MSGLDCCLPSAQEETLHPTQVDETEAIVNEEQEDNDSPSSCSESSSSELDKIFEATEVFSRFYVADDFEDSSDIPPKTKNELLPEELPFVEETFPQITSDFEMRPVGWISSVVESFLVIESFEAEPVLDVGSLIVFEDRNSVGRVFDVFGPVKQPFYSIRVRLTNDQLKDCLGKSVFFVVEYSRFVDTKNAYMKGSDASWYNDEEVPVELQECSDDENERKSSKLKSVRKDHSEKHTKVSGNLEANNFGNLVSTREQQDGKWINSEKMERTQVVQETPHLQTRTLPCLKSLQVSKGTLSIPGLARRSS